MSILTSLGPILAGAGTMLFAATQNAIQEAIPLVTTALVGWGVYHLNTFIQKNKMLKDIQINAEMQKAIEDMATTYVFSLYEKHRNAVKQAYELEAAGADRIENPGIAPDLRKEMAMEYLKQYFPDADIQALDSAIDKAVMIARPIKDSLAQKNPRGV